jgi:rod shape-determining protein MreC
VLVLVSLALITLHFRESDDGPIHAAQRIGVSVLMPFEVAGERISRPFRDGWGYVSDLLDAKSENEELKKENEQLRRERIANQTAERAIERLNAIATYVSGPSFPTGFEAIVATVVRRPPNPFTQQIMIAAGRNDGVVKNAPVVTGDGLVGLVTDVTDTSASVTLISDQNSAVTASISESGAWGIVEAGPSASTLVLDQVGKDELVEKDDLVVTAGWTTRKLESLFPEGIPIGVVESVGQQDVDLYKRVQVTPFVDFDSLSEVIVLKELPRERPNRGRGANQGQTNQGQAKQGQTNQP